MDDSAIVLTPVEQQEISAVIETEFYRRIEYKHLVEIKANVARGGFGVIHRGKWREHTVAIKVLNTPTDFIKEVRIHRQAQDSSRVVKFFGVTQLPTGAFGMVLQFAEHGSLRDFLKKKFDTLTWANKFELAQDVTKGLAFIHSDSICHHDLHSRNVLIDSKQRALITDFGLSRPLNKANVNSGEVRGVLAYISPERLMKHPFDSSSDIYSLGVIMWELSSGKQPFQDTANYNLAMDITNGTRESIIEGTPVAYSDLYRRCWEGNPKQRPALSKVDGVLESLIKAYALQARQQQQEREAYQQQLQQQQIQQQLQNQQPQSPIVMSNPTHSSPDKMDSRMHHVQYSEPVKESRPMPQPHDGVGMGPGGGTGVGRGQAPLASATPLVPRTQRSNATMESVSPRLHPDILLQQQFQQLQLQMSNTIHDPYPPTPPRAKWIQQPISARDNNYSNTINTIRGAGGVPVHVQTPYPDQQLQLHQQPPAGMDSPPWMPSHISPTYGHGTAVGGAGGVGGKGFTPQNNHEGGYGNAHNGTHVGGGSFLQQQQQIQYQQQHQQLQQQHQGYGMAATTTPPPPLQQQQPISSSSNHNHNHNNVNRTHSSGSGSSTSNPGSGSSSLSSPFSSQQQGHQQGINFIKTDIESFYRDCAKGNLEAIERHLQLGASVTECCENRSNRNAFHAAALARNHKDVFEMLLKHYPEVAKQALNEIDDAGQTPLHILTHYGEDAQNSLELLFEHGAKPNIRDIEKRTPLMTSFILYDNAQVVETLLDHGADPNLKYANNNALAEAAKLLRYESVKVLLDTVLSMTEPESLTHALDLCHRVKQTDQRDKLLCLMVRWKPQEGKNRREHLARLLLNRNYFNCESRITEHKLAKLVLANSVVQGPI